MKQDTGWKIIGSRYVVRSPHLRLRCDTIELPDGRRVDEYYVRESHGFAIIFAMTPDGRIVLVRQYKHGIGHNVLELPAGMIEPDEDPLACAQRELAEETGYTGDCRHVTTFITDPTGSSSRFHLYLVKNARLTQDQHLDPTEEIEVELASLSSLRGLIREGAINVGSSVAAIYFMLDQLKEH